MSERSESSGWPARAEALRLLARHARPHLSIGAVGMLGTLCVVITRIAMPWPLRGVIEVAFPGEDGASSGVVDLLPAGSDPVLALCLAYLALASLGGLAEFLQRVWMVRFASQTVHDLRAAALESVRAGGAARDPADLVARVVGDSARLKTNLAGVLVHLSQNGLLIVGITALFLFLAPKLGLLFLASGLIALGLGYSAVDEVTETSLRQRETEARYARRVQRRALGAAERGRESALNKKSTRKQVQTARLLGRATLLSHVGVATTIGLALWVGVADVRSGELKPGELFLFIAYALTLHRRAVRVGRQVARIGKIVANTQRLGALAGEGPPPAGDLPPLRDELRLAGVRLRAARSHTKRNRLGPLDLRLPAGSRVAVFGGRGDGKTSLLRLVSGEVEPSRGEVFWDEVELGSEPRRLRDAVAFVDDAPTVERAALRELLGPACEDTELLDVLGVSRLAHRLQQGLDTVVDGIALSAGERRAVRLASLAHAPASVWALDEPLDAGGRKDARRMAALLERAEDRTVFVALQRPCRIERFTHVVVLRKGKLAFVGSPVEWESWKREARALRRPRLRGIGA